MKSSSKKGSELSLINQNNYNKNLNNNLIGIIKKYIALTNEYLIFVLEKTNFKNENYFKFIILRGYNTITNVFNNLLFYTKNLDLTFYHCQKAYYYYVEFIEQISDEQHSFLQLTSRDASTYVYKKIFIDLQQNKSNLSNEIKNKLTLLDECIKIFNIIFAFIIQNLNIENKNLHIEKYKIYCEKIINLLFDLDSDVSFNLKLNKCKTIFNSVECLHNIPNHPNTDNNDNNDNIYTSNNKDNISDKDILLEQYHEKFSDFISSFHNSY